MTLPTIQMFWHGPALTRIERLCMQSFLDHGHPVHLYGYEPPENAPGGVQILDAEEILSRKSLFRHPKTGSMAIFADWFRYRVLHEKGGIWADTDVVCLRPIDYPRQELFAWQDPEVINNAIIGLPVGHDLASIMAECCNHPNKIRPFDGLAMRLRKLRRRWFEGNLRENVEWGENGPLGFTRVAHFYGYSKLALPSWHFYPVYYDDWFKVFDGTLKADSELLERATALHLWNEMMRREPGFDKNGRFPGGSLFEHLCARHSVES